MTPFFENRNLWADTNLCLPINTITVFFFVIPVKTDSTQMNNPFNPTPTLALPLKGREIAIFLPFQGEGEPFNWFTALSMVEGEGDGVSVGTALNLP
jgi:hypothetical protein